MIPIPEEIVAERLVIRPFSIEDLSGFLDFMTNPRATRHLLLSPNQRTEAGAKALFDFVIDSYASDNPIWALAVATEADGFVGSCGMMPIDETVFECYYSLLPSYWGRGLATEAMRALLEYLFVHSSVQEIRAYVSPDNPRSLAVAARLGMVDHGIHPHPESGKEGRMYSVTRKNWRSNHDEAESQK